MTVPDISFAHGGGLDAAGCHHDRKNGGYHCHRSGYTSAPVINTYPVSTNALPLTSALTTTTNSTASSNAELENVVLNQAIKIKQLENTIAELQAKLNVNTQLINTNDSSIAPAMSVLAVPKLQAQSSTATLFKITVKTIQANVRSTPDLGTNNIIGTVDKGTNLEVLDENGKFYLVSTSKGNGYLHKTAAVKSINTVLNSEP